MSNRAPVLCKCSLNLLANFRLDLPDELSEFRRSENLALTSKLCSTVAKLSNSCCTSLSFANCPIISAVNFAFAEISLGFCWICSSKVNLSFL